MSERTDHLTYLIFKAANEGNSRPDYFMHLQVPLNVLVSMCAHLQIALRTVRANPRRFEAYDEHGNRIRSASGQLVRDMVESIIVRMKEEGLYYNAQFLAESWAEELSRRDDDPAGRPKSAE